MKQNRYQPELEVDVCLLLEGTYPYVRGGVSSWVRQLIEGMPDLTFSIVFLGASEADVGEPAYELPDNLLHLETHFLLDDVEDPVPQDGIATRLRSMLPGSSRPNRSEVFDRIEALHRRLRKPGSLSDDTGEAFADVLSGENRVYAADMRSSREAWDNICRAYAEAPPGLDFNHYFWSVRGMHAPLFKLAGIANNAPKAKLYHSVSTGYAGFLGTLIRKHEQKPFLISEHGIYTKERELDLAQVDWIPEELDPFRVGLNDDMSYLRNTWIRFFRSLGRMSYAAADAVYTLYEGNRQRQVADGCPSERLQIIPNGVNVPRFEVARRGQVESVPPVLALIGRVVPIKDIKTFIRSMRIIRSRIPDAEGWLIGPEDEDPGYTRECRQLVGSLGLEHVVKFRGFQKPEEIFPDVGLLVLTSVSEGQPLVVLEGFAAGVPALTTDVGSCRELIEGVSPEDHALGSAGAVVSIANPNAFADAAVELLSNKERWQAASDTAVERVESFYDERDMLARYHAVYLDHLQAPVEYREAS